MTTKTSTEQFRADFEALERKRKGFGGDTLTRAAYEPNDEYLLPLVQARWEGYQAGRAALQSQDRADAAMAETLREAAEIIFAIQPEHAPKNIRWPIVDELHGFASMIDHARRIEGEGE